MCLFEMHGHVLIVIVIHVCAHTCTHTHTHTHTHVGVWNARMRIHDHMHACTHMFMPAPCMNAHTNMHLCTLWMHIKTVGLSFNMGFIVYSGTMVHVMILNGIIWLMVKRINLPIITLAIASPWAGRGAHRKKWTEATTQHLTSASAQKGKKLKGGRGYQVLFFSFFLSFKEKHFSTGEKVNEVISHQMHWDGRLCKVGVSLYLMLYRTWKGMVCFVYIPPGIHCSQ